MPSLLDRCAYAFFRDLPAGESAGSESLRQLAERMGEDDLRPNDLDERLRTLDLSSLMELQSQFMQLHGAEVSACTSRPLRVGERDHFIFEDHLRRESLTIALEAGDLDQISRLCTPASGTQSPFFRREVSPDGLAQWPVLEALVEAALSGDASKAVAARELRDGITSTLRDRTRVLTPAIRAVIRRLTGRTRQSSALPVDASPALKLRALRPLAGIQTVLVEIPPNVSGDRLIVRPAYPTQGVVLLVDPDTGTLTTSVPAGPDPAVSCRAYSLGGEPLDVVVALLRGTTETATATVALSAAPVGSLPLVGTAPGAVAAVSPAAANTPVPAPATPVAAATSPHPSPTSLSSDPQMQRALSRYFAQEAVSDTDLFEIGGAMLIARWAVEFPTIARKAGLHYVMHVGPEGKMYRTS